MKRFKELRSEIKEINEEHSEGGGFGYDETLKSMGRSASPKVKPVHYDDAFELGKINAFVQAFTSKSYLDPRSALYLLKTKLNLANVDFDLNNGTELELEKEYEFPLKRFGGTFGTSPSHDLSKGFEKTNGFGDKNFVLKCKVVAPNGKAPYFIQAEIVEK